MLSYGGIDPLSGRRDAKSVRFYSGTFFISWKMQHFFALNQYSLSLETKKRPPPVLGNGLF